MAILKAGIVGAGGRAQAHARGMRATADLELVAAAEVVPEKLAAFGQTWEVSGLYATCEEMLERERLDVVTVCTRNHQHVEPTIAAAEAGVRAIFCEKPLALSLGEADRMIAACARAGAPLCVDHSMRFEANYLHLKELIDDGAIGELLTVTVLAHGDLGELTNNATHSFDTLRMFNGDAAWILPHLERRVERRNDREDLYAIVGHTNGARGILQYGGYTEYRYEGFVFDGSRGRIETVSHRGWEPLIRIWRYERGPSSGFRDGDVLPSIQNDEVARAYQELVACVTTGRPCRSDGHDGRAALELTLACYEARRRDDAKITLPLRMAESPLDLALAEGSLPPIWARGIQCMS
jgi:UDP-N-acetylglucosamine 3-dehydrogenase